MRLRSLRIRRMPGIDPREGFDVEFDADADVVVVAGSNGSGKSTLVNALRALLWRDERFDTIIEVAGAVELPDGRVLDAERLGDAVAWRHDGSDADAPLLPPSSVGRGLAFGIEDLFDRNNATAAEVDAHVQRALTGGYDIDASLRCVEVSGGKRPPERRSFDEARDETVGLGRQQRELDDKRSERARLDQEIEDAEHANKQLVLVGDEIALREQRGKLWRIAERRSAMPVGMTVAAEDDENRLSELRDGVARVERRRTEHEESVRAAEQIVHECMLDTPLPDGTLEQLDSLIRELEESRETERTCRREHQAATSAREEAERAVGAIVDESNDAESLDLESADEVRRLAGSVARRGLALDAGDKHLQMMWTQLDASSSDDEAAEPELLSSAMQRLDDLLTYADQATDDPHPPGRRAVAITGTVSMVAGIAAGVIFDPSWWLLAALGVGMVIGVVAQRRFGAGTSAVPTMAAHRERLERASSALRAIDEQTEIVGADRQRIRELRDSIQLRYGRSVLAHERQRNLERQRAELRSRAKELEGKRRELDADRARLRTLLADAGYEHLEEDEIVARLLDAALRLADQEVKSKAAQAALNAAKQEVTDAEQPIILLLKRVGEIQSPLEPYELRGLRERLATADRRLREARSVLDHASAERELLDTELEGAQHRIRDFCERRGLEATDADRVDERVRECLQLLEVWRALGGEERATEAGIAMLEQRLHGAPQLAVLSDDELGTEQQRLANLVERRDRLVDERAAIDAEMGEARRRHDLAEALLKQQEAHDALERKRENVLEGCMATLLLRRAAEVDEQSRPAVIQTADHWLRAFTNGEYGLLAPRGGDSALRARDFVRGVDLQLRELSTGTRAQLMLAARVAWATEAEGAGVVRVPIVLDEALATADDERLRLVLRSLVAVAREQGRQLWYLTSDRSDLPGVRAAVGDGLSVTEIDLDNIRGRAVQAQDAPSPLGTAQELPALAPRRDGEPWNEWAIRMRVSRLDGFASAGEAHVVHLLRERDDLVHVLSGLRITRAGALEALARPDLGIAVLAAEDIADIRLRLNAWQLVHHCWSQGRGRPLHRSDALGLRALQRSNFREPVAELAQALLDDTPGTNNAQALLEILETSGHPQRPARISDKLVTSVRDELEREGYLPDGTPMQSDVLRARVLGELGADLDQQQCRMLVDLVDAWLDWLSRPRG